MAAAAGDVSKLPEEELNALLGRSKVGTSPGQTVAEAREQGEEQPHFEGYQDVKRGTCIVGN